MASQPFRSPVKPVPFQLLGAISVNSDPNHCTKALASESGPIELERHQCGFDITAVRRRSTRAKEFTVWRYYPSCVRLATCRAAELAAIAGDRENCLTSLTGSISLICGRAGGASFEATKCPSQAEPFQLPECRASRPCTCHIPSAGRRTALAAHLRAPGWWGLFICGAAPVFWSCGSCSRDVALAFRPAFFSTRGRVLRYTFGPCFRVT